MTGSRNINYAKRMKGTASVLVATALVCLGGCERGQEESGTTDAGVKRTAQNGPVTLTLTAAPAKVDLSQHLELQLEITAGKGVTVVEDDYGRALGEGDHQFEYHIVDSGRTLAEPVDGGKLRWLYRYDLEFFLPGEYELPAAEVFFIDVRAVHDGEGPESGTGVLPETQTLSTEAVTVAVLPPEGAPLTAEELRDIKTLPPVDLPRRWNLWWWVVPPAALALLLAVALLLRRSRRRLAESAVRIPAHEWARQQLAALIAEDLLAKGCVQEFHYRVSAIVRGYVERRFGVSAPEMTTEEFLLAAVNDARFGKAITDELNRFLTACDLVKYALHEPKSEESGGVLKTAGEFVERTREPTATAAVPGAGEET